MPITTVSVAPSTIITTVPVAGIVPRPVIRIPVPVGRSGITICRRWIAIGSWRWIAIGSWRWIAIPWATIIPIPLAADDSTNNRCTRAHNRCRCPYNRPRTVPPATVTTPPMMTP
jgi:hypothetical protein